MKKIAQQAALVLAATLVAAPAFAQDAAANNNAALGMKFLAAAIAISISVLGGAFAQGKTAAAALDGIARNPGASGKIFTSMIIGLALIESLVIYALIIAFQLV